jgi:hypothetical protein
MVEMALGIAGSYWLGLQRPALGKPFAWTSGAWWCCCCRCHCCRLLLAALWTAVACQGPREGGEGGGGHWAGAYWEPEQCLGAWQPHCRGLAATAPPQHVQRVQCLGRAPASG